MGRKWRCPRCGHEITESATVARMSTTPPRCRECETSEKLYPGGPRVAVSKLMEEA